jgi:L-arabinokinase
VTASLLPLLLPAFASFATDFIYSEYLTTQRKTEFKRLVWQIAQDYSNAALLLRLPGYVPMPAFTAIEDVPLVVRHARKFPAQVRRQTHSVCTRHRVLLLHLLDWHFETR